MLRQSKVSFVLAAIRQFNAASFPKLPQLSAETLLSAAQDMGLVVGVRGRGGGYEATDAGLEFININVSEFKAQEAAEEAKHAEAVKEAKKEAQKRRFEALESSLANASVATEKLAQAVAGPVNEPVESTIAAISQPKRAKKQKQAE